MRTLRTASRALAGPLALLALLELVAAPAAAARRRPPACPGVLSLPVALAEDQLAQLAALGADPALTPLRIDEVERDYEYSVELQVSSQQWLAAQQHGLKFNVLVDELIKAFHGGHNDVGDFGVDDASVFGTSVVPDMETMRFVWVAADEAQRAGFEITPQLFRDKSNHFYKYPIALAQISALLSGGIDPLFDRTTSALRPESYWSSATPSEMICYTTSRVQCANPNVARVRLLWPLSRVLTNDGRPTAAGLTQWFGDTRGTIAVDPGDAVACLAEGFNHTARTNQAAFYYTQVAAYEPLTAWLPMLRDNVPYLYDLEIELTGSRPMGLGLFAGALQYGTRYLKPGNSEANDAYCARAGRYAIWPESSPFAGGDAQRYQGLVFSSDHLRCANRFWSSVDGGRNGSVGLKNLAVLRAEPWVYVPPAAVPAQLSSEGSAPRLRIYFKAQSNRTGLRDMPSVEDAAVVGAATPIDFDVDTTLSARWHPQFGGALVPEAGSSFAGTVFYGNLRRYPGRHHVPPAAQQTHAFAVIARGERETLHFFLNPDQHVTRISSFELLEPLTNDQDDRLPDDAVAAREFFLGAHRLDTALVSYVPFLPVNQDQFGFPAHENTGLALTLQIPRNATSSPVGGVYRSRLRIVAETGTGDQTLVVSVEIYVSSLTLPEVSRYVSFFNNCSWFWESFNPWLGHPIGASPPEAGTALATFMADMRYNGSYEPIHACATGQWLPTALWAAKADANPQQLVTLPQDLAAQHQNVLDAADPELLRRIPYGTMWHNASMLVDFGNATHDGHHSYCSSGLPWSLATLPGGYSDFVPPFSVVPDDPAQSGTPSPAWEACVAAVDEDYSSALASVGRFEDTNRPGRPAFYWYIDEIREPYAQCSMTSVENLLERMVHAYDLTKDSGWGYLPTINGVNQYGYLSDRSQELGRPMVPRGIEIRVPETLKLVDADRQRCRAGVGICPIDDFENHEVFLNGNWGPASGVLGYIYELAGRAWNDGAPVWPRLVAPPCGNQTSQVACDAKAFAVGACVNGQMPVPTCNPGDIDISHPALSPTQLLAQTQQGTDDFDYLSASDAFIRAARGSLPATTAVAAHAQIALSPSARKLLGPFYVQDSVLEVVVRSEGAVQFEIMNDQQLAAGQSSCANACTQAFRRSCTTHADGFYFVEITNTSGVATLVDVTLRFTTDDPWRAIAMQLDAYKNHEVNIDVLRLAPTSDLNEIEVLRKRVALAFDAQAFCTAFACLPL